VKAASLKASDLKPEDFGLPTNKEEWDSLVAKFMVLGLSNKDPKWNIDKRNRLYKKTVKGRPKVKE
jgi:hypothetical protein